MLEANKMKILHLRDTHEVGGPGKTIIGTARELENRNVEIDIGVIGKKNMPDTPFIVEAVKSNCNVVRIIGDSITDMCLYKNFYKVLREGNYDIVHSHEPLTNYLTYIFSFMFRFIPVSTIHGYIGNSKKERFYNYFDKIMLSRFSSVIVVSYKIKSELENKRKLSSKCKVLHNCIDPGILEKSSENPEIRKLFDSNLDKIVYIGRLSQEKGVIIFLKAIKELLKKGFIAKFYLIGDGPEKIFIQTYIRDNELEEHVVLTGYLQDIWSVYLHIDLLVLPSYTEGLPNVVLEALLFKVPVVATKVGGTPEIINNNIHGTLIRAGSIEELMQAMIQFIKEKDRHQKQAVLGYKRVMAEFNFQRRTSKLHDIYTKLCGL